MRNMDYYYNHDNEHELFIREYSLEVLASEALASWKFYRAEAEEISRLHSQARPKTFGDKIKHRRRINRYERYIKKLTKLQSFGFKIDTNKKDEIALRNILDIIIHFDGIFFPHRLVSNNEALCNKAREILNEKIIPKNDKENPGKDVKDFLYHILDKTDTKTDKEKFNKRIINFSLRRYNPKTGYDHEVIDYEHTQSLSNYAKYMVKYHDPIFEESNYTRYDNVVDAVFHNLSVRKRMDTLSNEFEQIVNKAMIEQFRFNGKDEEYNLYDAFQTNMKDLISKDTDEQLLLEAQSTYYSLYINLFKFLINEIRKNDKLRLSWDIQEQVIEKLEDAVKKLKIKKTEIREKINALLIEQSSKEYSDNSHENKKSAIKSSKSNIPSSSTTTVSKEKTEKAAFSFENHNFSENKIKEIIKEINEIKLYQGEKREKAKKIRDELDKIYDARVENIVNKGASSDFSIDEYFDIKYVYKVYDEDGAFLKQDVSISEGRDALCDYLRLPKFRELIKEIVSNSNYDDQEILYQFNLLIEQNDDLPKEYVEEIGYLVGRMKKKIDIAKKLESKYSAEYSAERLDKKIAACTNLIYYNSELKPYCDSANSKSKRL